MDSAVEGTSQLNADAILETNMHWEVCAVQIRYHA